MRRLRPWLCLSRRCARWAAPAVPALGVLAIRTPRARTLVAVAGRTLPLSSPVASREPVNPPPSQQAKFDAAAQRAGRALELLARKIDLPSKRERLREARDLMEREEVWSDPQRMASLAREAASLAAQTDPVEALTSELRNLQEMHDMAHAEGETEVLEECCARVVELAEEATAAQRDALLRAEGAVDEGGCFVELMAGAGGRESADWTEMLLRMYTRWAQGKGFRVQVLQEAWGEGGGLRSVTIKVEGHLARGWFRSEAGVHRLVRISPFDSNARRHTSFAQVRVLPASTDESSASSSLSAIPAKDLRVDTFRSQGAGGQHVNTTDSAVRLTHLPTGLVATCQADRSQHRNKALAMEVLRAKLLRLQQDEEAEQRAAYTAGLGDNSWGNQIRSYVMQPYQLVKDHRTGVEVGDVQRVLGGDIDTLVEAALAGLTIDPKGVGKNHSRGDSE